MVKFVEVSPDDIPNFRESHRGRVSYPILKSFLETGKPLVMLDRTGMQQGIQSLNSCLNAYIRGHALPIKLFNRGGQIYLARTDVDEETGKVDEANNSIGNVKREVIPVGKAPDGLDFGNIPVVTAEEVQQRFQAEKDQTTK
jgi:hypothetical protein